MDPRPYHFDYRRPRPNNPTLYSNKHTANPIISRTRCINSNSTSANLLRIPNIKDSPKNKNLKVRSCTSIITRKRAHSTDIQTSKMLQKQTNNGINLNSSFSSVQKYGGAMAGYGRNILGANHLQRYQIFQKQSQNHDIISYSPKPIRPTLRKFPKLTLEDKLLEFGLYPKKE